MAVVYRALMEGPDGFTKMVALKLVHEDYSRHSALAKQFVSEARLGGVLSHPNIVEIIDYGREGDRFYLAMEYVDGPTLSQVVRYQRWKREWLPPEVAIEIVIQVCRGLSYAHRAVDLEGNPLHLVHRDLKPSNVLLNQHGVAKIADFGVARAATNVVRTLSGHHIKGTGPYMSPEQAWGGTELDHRSDLFSAGILLFELLSLDYLYDGRTIEVALRQAQDADVLPRFARLPGCAVREPLVAVLKRALARDRDERFQSADEMAESLEEVLVGIVDPVPLRRWVESLGSEWRLLPGMDAAPAKILFPPGASGAVTRRGGMGTLDSAGATFPNAGARSDWDPAADTRLESAGEDTPERGASGSTLSSLPSRRLVVPIAVGALVGFLLVLGAWRWLAGWADGRPGGGGDRTPRVLVVQGGTPLEPDGGEGVSRLETGGEGGAVAGVEGTPGLSGDDGGGVAAREHVDVSEGTGAERRTPRASRGGAGSEVAKDGGVGDGSTASVQAGGDERTGGGSGGVRSDATARRVRSGFLSLNSRPRSRIMVDQAPVEGFPIRDLEVAPGEHSMVFRAEDGVQLLHHVFVGEGARITCTALFSQAKVVCRELGGG